MILRRLLGHLPVNIAQAVAGFGAVAAFTRLLEPSDYGRYALVLAASQLLHTLTLTWAEAAAFRFYSAARAEGRLQDHFATLIRIALAALLVSLAVIVGLWLSLQFDPAIATAAALAVAASAFRFISRIARETDRAAHKVARYSWRESTFTLLGLGLGIACAMGTSLGPGAPFLGLLIGGAAIAAIDLPGLLKSGQGGQASIGQVATFAAYGAPLALALSLELAVQTGARFILADALGEEAVGAYAAAFGLARTLDLIFVWAGMAAAPLALTAFEDSGREATLRVAREMARALVGLTVPAAIGLALVAGPLARAMVGEGLAPQTAMIAPWLAVSALFAGLSTYYFSEAFQLTRRTGLRAAVMLVPALLTLILVSFGANRFGLAGAAVGAAFATAVGTGLLALVGRRLLPLPIPWGDVARALAASAVMALVVLWLPEVGGWAELFLKAGLGALTYGAAAIAFDVSGARSIAQTVWRRLRAMMTSPSTPDTPAP